MMDSLFAAHIALDRLGVPRGEDDGVEVRTFTAAERISLFWPYQRGTRRAALPGTPRAPGEEGE